ncbi:MAG: dockerin type I repeat-containing protein [Planctomycetota bacterium]
MHANVLTASTLAACVTATAWSQGGWTPPPPTADPLRPQEFPGGSYVLPTFPIDRRPIAFQSLRLDTANVQHLLGDNDDANGNGHPDPDDNWAGFDALITKLDALYDSGWRRIALNRATGDLSLAFADMTAWQQYGYLTFIREWADAHPEVSLEIYILPQSISFVSESDLNDPATMQDVLVDFEPWHNSGIRTIWLDSSFGNASLLEAINKSPLLYDVDSDRRTYIASEAGSGLITAPGVWPTESQIPWLAASQNPFWWSTNFGLATPVNPLLSSVGYWYMTGSLGDIEDAYNHVRGGKWLGIQVGSMPATEWVRRVCEFGNISTPADFNGDGTVNSLDYLLFMSQYSDPDDADDPTFFEGDYDQDGLVTSLDYFAFMNDYSAGGGSPRFLGVSQQPPLWPEHRTP